MKDGFEASEEIINYQKELIRNGQLLKENECKIIALTSY